MVEGDTRVSRVLSMALERTRWWERDPRLFYLALTLTDTNPGQEGLTSKTLTLDPGVRVGEYVSCGQWFQTRFLLRMKQGTTVRVYISVLMLEVDHVTLMLRLYYYDFMIALQCVVFLIYIIASAKNLLATKLCL